MRQLPALGLGVKRRGGGEPDLEAWKGGPAERGSDLQCFPDSAFSSDAQRGGPVGSGFGPLWEEERSHFLADASVYEEVQ